MIIEEADFRMESIGDNLHFCDLSVLKTIKSRIECKHPDAMSLKKYIQDYKQEVTRLEELTKGI